MSGPERSPHWTVGDLDRCEHGRHAIDPCWHCPDGQSTGNEYLEPGTLIGHTLFGVEIRVPRDWRRE